MEGTNDGIIGMDLASGPDEMVYTLTDKSGKVVASFKSLDEAEKWLRDYDVKKLAFL